MGNVKTKPSYDSAGFHVIDPATNLLVSNVLNKAAFDLWRCPWELLLRWNPAMTLRRLLGHWLPSKMDAADSFLALSVPNERAFALGRRWFSSRACLVVTMCRVLSVCSIGCKRGGRLLPGRLWPSLDQHCASTTWFIVVECVLRGSNSKFQRLAETNTVQALVSRLWLDFLGLDHAIDWHAELNEMRLVSRCIIQFSWLLTIVCSTSFERS